MQPIIIKKSWNTTLFISLTIIIINKQNEAYKYLYAENVNQEFW
jgi:hypothetical protein